MREDHRTQREEQIAAAAYALLEEKGYAGTSMLSIARRAMASNETLYNWYGDKTGLFRALVIRNTDEIRDTLSDAINKADPPLDTLRRIGPMLLAMLTGPRAVALNRAAAADPTGVLSDALSQLGRGVVAPELGAVLERAKGAHELRYNSLEEALEVYLGLLIGDLQIRAVTGRMPQITQAAAMDRSDRALDYLQRVFR